MPKMSDIDLQAILDAKIQNAIGYLAAALTRAAAGRALLQGRGLRQRDRGAQPVVSRDVAEAVDSNDALAHADVPECRQRRDAGGRGIVRGQRRYGSGAFANSLSSRLAQQAGSLAYQNYKQGLTDLLKGATLAPQLANQDYVDLGQLANAGSTQQGLDQQQINDTIQRYNYNQNLPYNNLAQYMNLIKGNYGSSMTQTATNSVNPLAAHWLGQQRVRSLVNDHATPAVCAIPLIGPDSISSSRNQQLGGQARRLLPPGGPMPELSSSTYSETDARTPDRAQRHAEGMAPSGVNDAWRRHGAIKRAYDRDHAGSWCVVGGTGNAITLTYAIAPPSYVQGEKYAFKASASQ